MVNVVRLQTRRPRTFTSNEAFIEELREIILTSRMTYTRIAAECSLSVTTVNRLATGHTQWPRHTTLFAVLRAMNKRLAIVD